MRVKILGSAAGGGFPQWNCACSNCRRVRNGTLRGLARTQVQIAVSSDGTDWFLLSASPDLPRQIESFPELQPTAQSRETPIAAFVLPGADLDQILGLIMLRESQPLRVYATPSIRRIIMDNNIIFTMVRNQITWDDVIPDREFELTSVSGAKSGIRCLPFGLAGNFPHYVDSQLAASLHPADAVLGLRLESPSGKRLVYMPGVPSVRESWLAHLETADLLLLDATFWTDDELIRIQGTGRSARQMGHMPVSGPDGSLAQLAHLKRPRKVYIHVNNTNPVLDEGSPEYQTVRDAGWEVAHDGMEFEL
ncbi:MAG TPA: pyrroloquinoline quinone biosynthesis protein PqqB [Bryobacteraceae bacterium]|nr:pyrroloquinoline quinone biosynthesis protein PqqB [Bryobacteraceae bacterium]